MGGEKEKLDPRQTAFLQAYLDIKSETFGNALRSALKAGYSEEYANTIASRDTKWLSDNVGNTTMLMKAERNLDKALDIPIEDEKIGDRGLKATMFVASRLGKEKWSERSEISGPDGRDFIPQAELNTTVKKLKSKKK
jgi:hypothetical protein